MVVLAFLDFEATCDRIPPGQKQKVLNHIIEIPTILYRIVSPSDGDEECVPSSQASTASVAIDGDRLEYLGEFHEYVKPPIPLLPFCTEITKITNEQLEHCDEFRNVIKRHEAWIRETVGGWPAFQSGQPWGSAFDEEIIFVTCGEWDLKQCLYFNMDYWGRGFPSLYRTFLNFKLVMRKLDPEHSGSLGEMCECVGGFQGQPHSGIDDTRNMVRVFEYWLERVGRERVLDVTEIYRL